MSNSKEMDMLTDQAGCELPEVFYGKNKFLAVMPSKDFLFEICPVESISLTSFTKRERYINTNEGQVSCKNGEDTKAVNLIDIVPKQLQVQQAETWKKKDTTKIKDFTKLEIVSDWTFSTAYKGTYSFISNRSEFIKNTTDLKLTSNGD